MSKLKRLDCIGFGNLRLYQQPEDFCYGMDAVLLAGFAADRLKEERTLVDLGTGNGIVPLILAHKTRLNPIYGVEVQPQTASLARENMKLNGLEERITIIQSDVLEVGHGGQSNPLPGKVDAVTANPPYFPKGTGLTNHKSAKHIARHETTGDLKAFFDAGARLLDTKGSLFMIHRPARLGDLIAYGRQAGFEVKTLLPISPLPSQPPNLVLLHYIKGGGKECNYLPSISVYMEEGVYGKEILRYYEK